MNWKILIYPFNTIWGFCKQPTKKFGLSIWKTKLLDTLIEEYNENYVGIISPCMITTKRQWISLQGSNVLHSNKDFPQFQRVGHAHKRNIVEMCAHRKTKVEDTSYLVLNKISYLIWYISSLDFLKKWLKLKYIKIIY